MLDHLSQTLLPTLTQYHALGYWAAFLFALLETTFVVGMLVPGSTLLLFIGALAAGGYLDLSGVLALAVAGAILGDNLNYWLGRRYGRRWLRAGAWFLKEEHFAQARAFFDRHGAHSVFLGRFVPTLKEIVPFVAGSLGMRRRTFLFWNVLGACGWGLEWVGGGYLFAQSLGLAQIWLPRFGAAIALLLLLSLLWWFLQRLVLRHGRTMIRVLVSVSHSIAQAVAANPEVQRWTKAHPRLMAFLARRLARDRFTGLPASLLGLAAAYLALLFAGLVEDLLNADPIVALDHALAQIIAAFRTPELIEIFWAISQVGAWQVVLPALAGALVVFWRLGRPLLGLPLIGGVTGALAFTELGKWALHRPRPLEAVIAEPSYAFPSGHATISVAFYGFLAYLAIRAARTWRLRVGLFFAAVGLILLIGLSRLVLGVHYLSDVLSGYLLGAFWLVLAVALSEWLRATDRNRVQRRVPGRRAWAVGMGLGLVLWYGGFVWHHPPRLIEPAAPQPVQVRGPLAAAIARSAPAFTETLLGARQMPLSLALLARDTKALEQAFARAGWHPAARPGQASLVRLFQQGLADDRAPLAPAFWNGRMNTLTFERYITQPAPRLLAVQIWPTAYRMGKAQVYLGVAKAFDGVRWGLFHHLDPDLDLARERTLASLQEAGVVDRIERQPFAEASLGETLTGQGFFTRSGLWLIWLTGP